MKKAILYAFTMAVFNFNSKFYKQIDEVSIGLRSCPFLANIIIELKYIILKGLIDISFV